MIMGGKVMSWFYD